MKISVKTLKGEIFSINAEPTDQVSSLKQKIQEVRDDIGADRQKLIHAGKVLKDDQTVGELGLTDADFIVCMVTKEVKKPAAAAPTPAAPAPAAPVPAPTASLAPAPAAAPAAAPVPATPAPVAQPPVAPRAPVRPVVNISNEAVQALVGMGFPEGEVRAALTAAMGNPDLAYEFLITGIPDGLPAMMDMASSSPAPATPAAAAAAAASPSVGIESLRQHPQFNMLKQLVQQNPAALPQVLELIGAQNPELLAAIHANTEAFIAMMNEPITDSPSPAPAAAAQPPISPAMGGMGGMGMDMADPAQIMQLLAALPPAQRDQFAQSMGMSREQLEGFVQMMSSIPPEQLRSMLGGMGMGGGEHADAPNVIRLTEDEMAAVNRLMALGFSQQQAAQAYLACDKDEALAANLLLEGGWMEDDEGAYGGQDDGFN